MENLRRCPFSDSLPGPTMHQPTDTDNPAARKIVATRPATAADIEHLAQFNIAMALETEQLVLKQATVRKGVAHMLAHPELGFYLLAEIDGEIAGCLMLTSEWSDWRNGLFWWIQSVYVHSDYRQQGVYQALYRQVKQLAAKRGNICGFRLYVDQENTLAQACYQKLGMRPTHYLLYEEAAPEAIHE